MCVLASRASLFRGVSTRPSRADDRFLGIRGKFFVQKVAVTQMMTVLLQATAKLPVMARVASMDRRFSFVVQHSEGRTLIRFLAVFCTRPDQAQARASQAHVQSIGRM